MKEYKEMTQEIVDELAKFMAVDKFNVKLYQMYNSWSRDRGYYFLLSIDDDYQFVSLKVCRREDDKVMDEPLIGYWLNEICDDLSDVWHYVRRLPRGNVFDSVADCMHYLADEDYLSGGDTIEFVSAEDDDDKVVEVRTYGETHGLLATYKILG